MDFIVDFKNFILKHVPTNPDWAESVATNVLATVLDRKVHIMTKIGRLHPNLFFLVIGPSGLAYKTAPIKYYAMPTLIKYGELTDTKPLIPSRFSVEGLIEYLSTMQSSGVIIRDEFSSIFKDTRKQYIADVLEFLSELYDCTIQKRFTRKAKLEETLDVCVSLMSATTPYIFSLMDPSFFVQGTGNRILYIWSKVEKLQKTDKWFFLSGHRSRQKEEQLGAFAQRLAELRKTIDKKGVLQPIFYQAEDMVAFRDEMQLKTKELYEKDPQGIEHIYLARMAEMAIKLAAIKGVSRMEETLHKIPATEYPVSKEDVTWAINKVKTHINYFYEIKDNWSTFAQRKPVLTDEALLDYLLSIIKTHGGEIMHSQLLKLSKLSRKQFQLLMNTLIERKQIVAYEKTDYESKGGPKPVFYKIRKEGESDKRKGPKPIKLE